jgi:xylanolytic transcriptional activator XlnR
MPTARRCTELLETNAAGFVGIRRILLSKLVKRFHKIILPESQLSLDDGITAFLITSIGPSEEAIHSNLPYYLAFLKYVIKRLNLNMDTPELSEETREERRRLASTEMTHPRLTNSISPPDYGGKKLP